MAGARVDYAGAVGPRYSAPGQLWQIRSRSDRTVRPKSQWKFSGVEPLAFAIYRFQSSSRQIRMSIINHDCSVVQTDAITTTRLAGASKDQRRRSATCFSQSSKENESSFAFWWVGGVRSARFSNDGVLEYRNVSANQRMAAVATIVHPS